MKTDQNQLLSQSLISHSRDLEHSYTSSTVDITSAQLQKNMAAFLGNTVHLVLPLNARQFYVSIADAHLVTISVSKPQSTAHAVVKPVLFYPYVTQASRGLFVVVASAFNLYDYLNREPYQAAVGEYAFQRQLGNALGLEYASAYDTESREFIDEHTALEKDLSLMYKWDENFSFLAFKL